ncbi:ABC transporter ATP-binding protein [Guyparkeria hydrothermalis]|uniref:ABC transporter ATP-binding protein n=1 Tax=Guyparkeria hydrothermalis TaxID=923 RepID=UPI002021D6BB|nr:ABC transporter ATP-binding protein [Guyparkeria hydrothermalis]MCL7745468.1 ABC transporter ATP-binding protein [Guyparkeria hydrothermalis]
MIEIRNLYKRYHNHHGSEWVLRDINLTIPPGVNVGLLGRNGAGKSTLLRLIGGMDAPERGEVVRHSRVSWPIGLTGGFQGSMTGRQNVKFVARIHGGESRVHEVIEQVQSFAEIGKAFDEPMNTYSTGMRARLAFGMSLAFNFDIYLSDEATAVGDRMFKEKAKKAFKDKVGEASLIMVSHQEGILKELCHAGIYLEDGRATWFDDINDAIKVYHDATGGESKADKDPDDAPPADLTPADNKQATKWLKEYRRQWQQQHTALKKARQLRLPAPEITERKRAMVATRQSIEQLEAFLASNPAPGDGNETTNPSNTNQQESPHS